MAKGPGWFDRFVNDLPERRWFQFLSNIVVVPFWAAIDPRPKLPGGARPAVQPSESLQRMMNLIMPLKNKSPVGRAMAAMVISQNIDEIFTGLDNVGTIHFARFIIIDDKLCMLSVYDGDFSNYIRDFIVAIGNVFDGILSQVEDGDDVIPTRDNVEKFIDWVHDRDLFQLPDFATDIFALQDAAMNRPAGSPPHSLDELPRAMILQLKANPNFSLGGGYRGYAGFSVAQIRQKFGLGW